MKDEKCVITEIKKLSHSIYSLKFKSNFLKVNSLPGQFLNIKIDNTSPQILRRPFSISDIKKDEIEILFNVVGKGTAILSMKKEGDYIDVLGPLGNGFKLNDDYEKYIILGGGIGIAPFPYLIRKLREKNIKFDVFFGYRNVNDIVKFNAFHYEVSTDDGSFGFKGNVIEMFLSRIDLYMDKKVKVFACGPNIMLKNLEKINQNYGFEVEVSIESYMACGIGICQGCPVQSRNENKNYLVCKDGPCFNLTDIIL